MGRGESLPGGEELVAADEVVDVEVTCELAQRPGGGVRLFDGCGGWSVAAAESTLRTRAAVLSQSSGRREPTETDENCREVKSQVSG
jgi:hypothetical protein